MSKRNLLLLVIFIIALITCIFLIHTSFHLRDVKIQHDIPYGDGAQEKLDVYCHDSDQGNKNLLPVVIHIHGGGWRNGCKESVFHGAPAMCGMFAHMDFVAFAPSYPLKTPNQHLSVVKAIEWVHKNSQTFGGDPTRLWISGHSAGAHWAAMLLCGKHLGNTIPESSIRGFILNGAVIDLNQAFLESYKNQIIDHLYIRPTFGKNKKLRSRFSPLSILEDKNLSELMSDRLKDPSLNRGLKVLVMNASWDMGLESQNAKFAKLLRMRGVRCSYRVVPMTLHQTVSLSNRTADIIRDFVS